MKLQTIGKLLIGIGAVVVIYAFLMPVSLRSSGVVNIHLLNERQNTLLIGELAAEKYVENGHFPNTFNVV